MAVPTSTSAVATRIDALRTEVAELEAGCRSPLTGSAAANEAARQLVPQFSAIRKQLARTDVSAIKSRLQVPIHSTYEKRHVRVNATADQTQTVITGTAGKSIYVLGYSLTLSGTAAGASTIQDSAGSPAVYAAFSLAAANTAIPIAYAGGEECPAFKVAPGLHLVVNNATNVDLTGHLTYALV